MGREQVDAPLLAYTNKLTHHDTQNGWCPPTVQVMNSTCQLSWVRGIRTSITSGRSTDGLRTLGGRPHGLRVP